MSQPDDSLAALAYAVCTEANHLEAEQRDRECRCPGRAYVVHAWDLASHKTGCRAGYAWTSVDEVRAVLQTLSRRQLADLERTLT